MIELWDGYCVSSDEYQFILGRPTMRKNISRDKDELRLDSATYHASLAQALTAFYRIQLRESIRSNEYSLAQAIAVSAQIENRIQELAMEPILMVGT